MVIRRLPVLLVGSSLGAVGWGAVLPYLYADITVVRGLGPTTAAITFSAFALGALAAAPLAGRLADGPRPVAVATVARMALAATIVGLMWAGSSVSIWVMAFAYGAALAAIQPAVQVLVLAASAPHRRRDAFAWQFIGQNLALAAGGFAGGFLVDLSTPDGMRPVYLLAASASVASALTVALVSRGAVRRPARLPEPGAEVGYLGVFRTPGVGWLLAVTAALTLACYAQFDSGLPAYVLSVLAVKPTVLGTAVAVNAVLVALITGPVVAATRRFHPATLLAASGLIWAGVWVVIGLPLLHRAWASALILAGYALFSAGETVLAPVLSPLAAALAPDGATGRTLAAVTGAQTLATAIGPGLAAGLLALGLPGAFITMQVTVCLVAVAGARKLRAVTGGRVRHPELAIASS